MNWNWQLPTWPNFEFNAEALLPLEKKFLLRAGEVRGSIRAVPDVDQTEFVAETITIEAITTSQIEGETLNRESVQSSILTQLGVQHRERRASATERGISQLLVAVYRDFAEPLTHERLWEWHALVLQGRSDVPDLGKYRTDPSPMQIVSGSISEPKVHFEAPPAVLVPKEMQAFLAWFSEAEHPPLTKAGLAHLYFESIHPFSDGNGRLGRALCDVAISRSLGYPSLTLLSRTIQARQSEYYAQLQQASSTLVVDSWLNWFANCAIEAQAKSLQTIEFVVAKAKLFAQHGADLNERQEKALLRMFKEGPSGFRGGLSAKNYAKITGASPATVTRDLTELVEMQILTRTGENRGARYHLKFTNPSS
jgi:Fic family protein